MTLDGRTEARLQIAMPIYLIDRRRTAQPPELALTENVSSNGVRVVSKWLRKPGEQERFTLLSGERALAAQVVYCHQTPNNSYCIGLRLRQPCAGWWHAQAKPVRLGVAARFASIWREGFISALIKDRS
jgi:hypothetical protein